MPSYSSAYYRIQMVTAEQSPYRVNTEISLRDDMVKRNYTAQYLYIGFSSGALRISVQMYYDNP